MGTICFFSSCKRYLNEAKEILDHMAPRKSKIETSKN